MKNDTSSPAFHSHGSMGEVNHCGMTLRDYFAAKALQGMLADANNPDPSPEAMSHWAYIHADAMLAEREK